MAQRSMTRVVIDTNLIIAARYKPKSATSKIIDLCLEQRVLAVDSGKTKDENLFILQKVRPSAEYLHKIIKFYSKDPSKVDRSASYMARHVAKNIVAAGLADRCEIQFAYALGFSRPVSLLINTFGTNKVPEEKIEELVKKHFDLRPKAIIDYLNLRRPIFEKTTNYGHFGRNDPDFTWEKTEIAKVLRQEAGLSDNTNTPGNSGNQDNQGSQNSQDNQNNQGAQDNQQGNSGNSSYPEVQEQSAPQSARETTPEKAARPRVYDENRFVTS